MKDLSFSSPDEQHVLTLRYADEVRFGPACYSASLDDRAIADRVFGHRVLWSPDSRYIALQLWNSVEESSGPDTSLFVIDLPSQVFWCRSRARGGFIETREWQGSVLLFDRCYYGRLPGKEYKVGRVEHGQYDVDLSSVEDWQPLFAE